MRRNLPLILFLSFLYLVHPFISGYLAGLNIQKSVVTVTASGAQVERGLSGSQFQTAFWDLDAGGTVTVEIGVKIGGDVVYASYPGAGPFTVTGGVPEFQPIFIPVAERLRLTYTGAGTGSLAILDS